MEEIVKPKLPLRPSNANKGTFGKVLIFAGSKNFPGAAYLCATAAYRVGAGFVTLATIPSVRSDIVKVTPEVTYISFSDVEEKIKDYDSILIGPGLGTNEQIKNLVLRILGMDLKAPFLIDADGLNILATEDKWWEKFKGDMILTPHPGEMSRLTRLSISDIQNNREKVALEFAKKWNKVVVLKGANTIIATPEGEVFTSPFANPVLATAGTGDVLSGIISGFLSQGLDYKDAAVIGVFIHAQAGESLSRKIGDTGSIASDLLSLIPQIIKKIKLG